MAVCCCKTSPSTAASLVFGSSRLMKCRVWTLTSGGGPLTCFTSCPFAVTGRTGAGKWSRRRPQVHQVYKKLNRLRRRVPPAVERFLRVEAFSSILASGDTHTRLAGGGGVVFQEPSPFLRRSSWLRVIFTAATRVECQYICMK